MVASSAIRQIKAVSLCCLTHLAHLSRYLLVLNYMRQREYEEGLAEEGKALCMYGSWDTEIGEMFELNQSFRTGLLSLST